MAYRQTVKSWNDKITFGEFNDKTFGHILQKRPSYIIWLDEEGIVELPRWMIDEATAKDANNSPPEDYYWQPG
jgi:hypothetical protein